MHKLKVLIPTDFSIQADYAYILINRLRETLAMEIHFLHVLNFPDTVTVDSSGEISTCGEIDAGYVAVQWELTQQKLAALKSTYGNEIQTHVTIGRTTESIVAFAENGSFDVIAMGTKGAWGLKERLSGTETQHVARKTSVPVLSLMCDRSELNINHVLLVHDFSDEERQDLGLISKFLSTFHPTLHLLQVIQKDREIERVEHAMDNFAERHGLQNYQKHVLNDRDVESGVIHFNQMNNMDLVCIGTHQKPGLFHTSATEKLINHLFKPVISFPLN